MKAIMIMFDSLNRHFLPNYGCELTKMPNFQRLGNHTVVFDNSYVSSLPCMPARRELHTGRINFLHRGWGPIEPFDDSMPQLLKQNNVYTHLVSDHQHYWEDGGCTYHTRYQSWEAIRGQEGDPCIANLNPIQGNVSFGPSPKGSVFSHNWRRQDLINRSYVHSEKDFPQVKTFTKGLDFIDTNHNCDDWFLQIETFDPHEPFFSPEEYQALYNEEGDSSFPLDWPPYGPVLDDHKSFISEIKKKYFALLSLCDAQLGRILDVFDKYEMWDDTMLIVNTDHGFLLGEHSWWSKAVMPVYNELANTPLFIWDPRCKKSNERRQSLVQTIDIAPTLLDFFGVQIPNDMQGCALADTIDSDKKIREHGLFGFFGSHVNITDGHYVYMRSPSLENSPLYEYTLMPTNMRALFSVNILKQSELASCFSFTKEVPLLKIPSGNMWQTSTLCSRFGNRLYNLDKDPEQKHPIDDAEKELELIHAMIDLMEKNDAPDEQFKRLRFEKKSSMSLKDLLAQRDEEKLWTKSLSISGYEWDDNAYWGFRSLITMLASEKNYDDILIMLSEFLKSSESTHITTELIYNFAKTVISPDNYESAIYTLETAFRTD